MAGVMVMADVVVPPSGSEPESSRRARPDVKQERDGIKEEKQGAKVMVAALG